MNQEESLDKDISALASGINLKLNEDSPNDEDVGDFLELSGFVNTDAADEDRNQNKVRRLSDDDVLNLPIQHLKPEDLARRKKLQHCRQQERYLKKLVETKGEEYVQFSHTVLKKKK